MQRFRPPFRSFLICGRANFFPFPKEIGTVSNIVPHSAHRINKIGKNNLIFFTTFFQKIPQNARKYRFFRNYFTIFKTREGVAANSEEFAATPSLFPYTRA